MEATTIQQATPESVWAAIQVLTEKQAETDRQMKETDRKIEKVFEDTTRIIAERQAKLDRQIEKVNETLGAWANNQGSFAEEYFINSFENGKKNFFGERFEDLHQRVTGMKIQDVYHILLVNGKSIGIVEVKYKVYEDDVDKVLKKAQTFRVNYPDYGKHQIYLGLASMAFYPELEQECIRNGIAIVKQVGDTVIINDEHLKVF
jgi:hypothetical protein